MPAAVYIRVSSTSQNEASQKREVKRWLKGQGMDSDAVWFVDKASGKDTDRPAFQELQQAIWNGDVETVVVWKLDRLSRSLRDGINILHDWCEKGLRVVSVTQQIDLAARLASSWPQSFWLSAKWNERIFENVRPQELLPQKNEVSTSDESQVQQKQSLSGRLNCGKKA